MAGSHRGDVQRGARRPLAVIGGVLLGALVAGVFAVVRLSGDDPAATPDPDPTSDPTSEVSSSSTPGATAPATPRPSPTPSATRKPTPVLPTLAPASPRRLAVPGLIDAGFDDSIEPDGDRFTTRSTAELSRWGSRGVPASPGSDTVFVAGRVAADGDSGFGSLPRVRAGMKVSLRTDAGVLTYTVRAVTSRDADGFTAGPLVTTRRPGRLVLVGVRYSAGGSATSTYVVVTAELTGVLRD